MQLPIDKSQSSLLTLHDAITDSPVYRSSSLHFDEQLDLLEKWLDTLSKNMKLYVDKLNKFNLETNTLCKKVIPVGIDDMMIDPNFTAGLIKSFSDALQTSLAFKTKLVSDLEDNFIQPLQLFLKTNLKDFKEFRKQHEKTLERFEAQLYKYAGQSKTKEASALREEAFRVYEARKAYVRVSGQHVVRMLHFRSLLERLLVEIFSSATTSHIKDFEGTSKSWTLLQTNLTSWKQWLIDDKETCGYQLNRLQSSRIHLESKYLAMIRPARDLEKYTLNATQAPLSNRHSLDFSSVMTNGNHPSHKWGYLFVRGTRSNWYRRWFFIYDGCFGSCHVNPSPKLKGSITLGDRVSVLLCDIKPLMDLDRRFCFEVMCAQQPSFVLQAETEEEMREWINAFEKSKRLMLQNEQLDLKKGTNLTSAGTETDTTKVVPYTIDNLTTEHAVDQLTNKPSIVMLSSSPETEQQSLSQSTSLTPLLVWEASRLSTISNTSASSAQTLSTHANTLDANASTTVDPSSENTTVGTNGNQTTTSSSWGIPWALVPSMFQGGNGDDLGSELPPTPGSPALPAITDADGHQVVWPIRMDDSGIPKVELSGYPTSLEERNKELRHLFGGVNPNEVVLTDFIGSLKKKPMHEKSVETNREIEVPSSPTVANTTIDSFEQELNSQLTSALKDPSSNHGYSYTGRGFITQETFWFYSCVLMTCVNTVAVRLRDIQNIRLVRDPSIAHTHPGSSLTLAIDLDSTSNNVSSPLIFTTLMDDVEVLAEKLKFAVSNAKSKEPAPLQITYDIIHSLSAAVNKNKNSHQVKTIIKSTPEPVRSNSDVLADHASTSSVHSTDGSNTPLPSHSTDTKKKNAKAPRKHSAPTQPKSGALAAAMMAATVAGGSGFFDARKGLQEESRHFLRGKKSKSNLSFHQEEEGVPMPNSTLQSVTTAVTLKEAEKPKESPKNMHDVPDGFKMPSEPVSCGCADHLDKLEAEIEVPVSAKHLFYILFSEDNPNYQDIWEKKTVENKSRDLTMTPWQMVNGKKERTLKYIIPVNNSMVKVKEAEAVEKQTIEKAEEYLCYTISTTTKTAQLPYADAFMPFVKYCITWVDRDHSKLSCYVGVKFLKNILVKGIVNKAVMKGISENLAIFMPIVQNETSKSQDAQDEKKETTGSVSLKRMGTIKRPSKVVNESQPDTQTETPAQGWYATVEPVVEAIKDLVGPLPMAVKMGALGFLLFLFLLSWFRAGSRKPMDSQVSYHGSPTRLVSSRAVYLRDLDEGLFNMPLQSAYEQSESFRSFLESKSTNQTTRGLGHRWFSSHHHQFAIELLFSREKLAMLRHDALVLFQLVNEVDAQLLENEYMNWLMDTRLQCRASDVDHTKLNCDDVKRQLRSFSI
ncbi:putative PH domain-containing protein C19A8.02 [Choanephora cucurbitarum]|uniref:Putative PH domain-containing protein C19A8.02 n=1 Tax=Choanephora cucurbitarum TaxID=101091 RepID=A0A1C7NIU0_9FUNG|nr:putative PH domain-containing protein C19A8.02 [Choanephora cucurbitarum]